MRQYCKTCRVWVDSPYAHLDEKHPEWKTQPTFHLRPSETPVSGLDDVWLAQVEFQDAFKRWDDWREWDWTFLTNALAGEVGEACNLAKKFEGGGTHNLDAATIPKFQEELADVFIYLCLTAEDFARVIADKIKKNYERMERGDIQERAAKFFNSASDWRCPSCGEIAFSTHASNEPGTPTKIVVISCSAGHADKRYFY